MRWKRRREWERSLQIIHGDVLKVPLPFFDVLVANVPYNVSVCVTSCTAFFFFTKRFFSLCVGFFSFFVRGMDDDTISLAVVSLLGVAAQSLWCTCTVE